MHRYQLDRTSTHSIELHMDEEHLESLKRMVDYAAESFRLGQRYTQGVSKVHIAIKASDMSKAKKPAKAKRAKVIPLAPRRGR